MTRNLAGVLAIAMLGCAPPPVDYVLPTATAAPPAPPISHHTVWIGRYACAQGTTGLTLTLDTRPDGDTTATFDFGPLDPTRTNPPGSYRMRGLIAMASDGGFTLDLEPDTWIHQPPGYIMVGLTARSDPARDHMFGKITDQSCGGLVLDRKRS